VSAGTRSSKSIDRDNQLRLLVSVDPLHGSAEGRRLDGAGLQYSDLEAYTWFMTDVEWSWMSEGTPMEDW